MVQRLRNRRGYYRGCLFRYFSANFFIKCQPADKAAPKMKANPAKVHFSPFLQP